MRLAIHHETIYRYAVPARHTTQLLRLTPRREGRQGVLRWRIGAPGRRVEQVDAHGNVTHLLTLEEPHTQLAIVVDGEGEIVDQPELPNEGALQPLAYLAPTRLTQPDAAIRALAARCLGSGPATRERLQSLAEAVHGAVRYRPGAPDVEETATEALAQGEGMCQDQANVYLACWPAAGGPGRYVSGYFFAGDEVEAASHAWVDAWLPEDRVWRSVDITHLRPAGTAHCRLAVGRDYLDAAPVRGIHRGGGGESLTVRVQVATVGQ